jgi:hypothetical protein
MTTPENTLENATESNNSQLAHILENDADDTLEEAKTHWLLGEWEKLVELDIHNFTKHHKRGYFALLIAAAHQQLGNQDNAKKYTRLALEWKCPQVLVAKILIAGVHNSLGRISALNYNGIKVKYHFSAAIELISGKSKDSVCKRIYSEFLYLNLIEKHEYTEITENFHDLNKFFEKTKKAKLKINLSPISPRSTDFYVKNPYIHNRHLTPELELKLKNFISQALMKHTITPSYVEYLALKATEIEKNSIGRLATTIQDAVIRQVVAELVEDEHLGVLEIGALYGINLAILYNHCIPYFNSMKMICLDPFDGYYGKPVDATLGIPVTDKLFHRNMQLANISSDAYSLIKNYSTDEVALTKAKQEKITLLIIDGDHSYEGIKYDYENYFPLLEPGGYLIVDDYNAKEWPGVQKFVDETIKNDPACNFIGSFSRTAIGRKK